jgi:hypothetical protein
MHKIHYKHSEGDSRLLYGMGVPFGVAMLLIIGFMVAPATWMLPALMAVVIAFALVVLWGLSHMLDESGDDEPPSIG